MPALPEWRCRALTDKAYADHIITQYLLHQESDFATIEELLARWREADTATGEFINKLQPPNIHKLPTQKPEENPLEKLAEETIEYMRGQKPPDAKSAG